MNIGSSSLLIVFLVLCLTTFSVLSLSGVQSDYSFTKRFAQHKATYYEASSKAEVILDEIDYMLAKAYHGQKDSSADTGSENDIYTVLSDGLIINDIPISCTDSDEGMLISYQIPSGTKQALNVCLRINDTSTHDTYYDIVSWQLISVSDWNADNTLQLMPID